MWPAGPAWVGIGAQRSGTTWLTDLLSQHPRVALPRNGKKELHYFDRALFDGWSSREGRRYRSMFDRRRGRRPGEWTPYYLRGLYIPPLLRASTAPDTLILVLLRDPVERFWSGLRWAQRLRSNPGRKAPGFPDWVRQRYAEALWAGMYATQLAVWSQHFDRDQMIVLQYERVVADPQEAVDRIWGALGLAPVTLSDVTVPSATATQTGWADRALPGFSAVLEAMYEPEVEALAREWGVDRTLWSSTNAVAATER